MDVIDEALESSNTYLKHFIEARRLSTQPIDLPNSEAAELLLGRCNLSQRDIIACGQYSKRIMFQFQLITHSKDIVRN